MRTTTKKKQKLTFNIRTFRAWAKSLPKGETFSYTDNLNCPIATFYRSLGHEYVSVGGFTVRFDPPACAMLMPKRLQKVSSNLSFIHSKNSAAHLTKRDIINAIKD